MRIVLITNNYTPYSGGVVSSINVLVDGLQKKGYQVRIITLDFLDGPKDDPDYVYRLSCPFRFMYRKNYMAVPWRTTYHLLHYLKNYKPDIVHVHHPFLLGVAGLQVARKLECPVVFTYHTLYEEYHHYVPLFPAVVKSVIKHVVSSFCKQVDHIIAPSTYVKKSIQSNQIKTAMTVIPSAIHSCFVASEYPSTKRNSPVTLLSVGRFAPEKNLPFLLEVVKKLEKKFQLILAGYGSEQDYLQWYAYNKLQLSKDQVSFVISPSQKCLVTLYRQAALFLFASTTDTQGLVLAEAMAAGTPVVALDGPGQRDIVVPGYNGYLVSSQEEMRKKICLLFNRSLDYNRISLGAYGTGQNYTQGKFVDRIIRVYSHVGKG